VWCVVKISGKWGTLPTEEKARANQKRAEGDRKRREAMSPEEKARANQKRRERRAEMSPEEKARVNQKRRERWAEMTPEKKAPQAKHQAMSPHKRL